MFMFGRKKKKRKVKKTNRFVKILNKLLDLKFLKKLGLSIGFVKGFDVQIEFFEDKTQKTEDKK